MEIILSKDAAKVLARLDASARRRITQGISGIPKGDIKSFKGVENTYRLRIGNWRILFTYTDGGAYIQNIGPRGDVYK